MFSTTKTQCSWSGRAMTALAGTALAASALAQPPSWQEAVGSARSEVAYGMDFDKVMGGFVTVGRIARADVDADAIHVVRYNPDGRALWAKELAGFGRSVAYSVRHLPDNGFIVAGETDGMAIGGKQLLVRLDDKGDTVWGFTYAPSAFVDFPAGMSVCVHERGFAAVGRWTSPFLPGESGTFLVTTPAGVPVVQSAYSLVSPTAGSVVSFTDIRPSAHDTYIVSGWLREDPNAQPQALLVRMDAMGNVLWAMSYASEFGTTADGLDNFDNDQIVFNGRVLSPFVPGPRTVFGMTDASGNLLWSVDSPIFEGSFAAIRTVERGNVLAGGSVFGLDLLPTAASVKFTWPLIGLPTLAMQYNGRGSRLEAVEARECHRGYSFAGTNVFPPENNGLNDVLFVETELGLSSGCLENRFDPMLSPFPLRPIRRELSRVGLEEMQGWPHTNVRVPVDTAIYCWSGGCPADVDDGTMEGIPDGGVTIDDLLYYLQIFEEGVLCADIDDGTFTGTRDGGVTIDDLLYFLFRFEAGC